MTTNPFLLRCRSLWFRVASALALACAWGYVPALGQEPSALPEAQASLRDSVEAAVAKVKPALVRILVVEADYHDGRQVKLEASGSGVIISESGHVVTNHHVAGHATRLFCTLSTKEEVEAKLVGTDPLTDIAVIQLANDGTRKYPVAGFGDSTAVKVGDPVLAMGSPRALSQSVTLGIVSNTELVLPSFMRGSMELDGEDVGSMVRWIGHDAPIFGGNSGGPLVTLDGRIVGINEISLSLGGAIPGNLAKAIADELIRTGRVRRSWLGVEVQPLLRESGQTRGVLVSGVVRGGPAEASGLQSGDILVRLAGHDVTVRFAEELPAFNQMVAALPIGEEAEVTVLRGGQEVPLKVRTADREEAYPNQHEFKQWGLTGRDLSFMLAAEMKRDSRNGVLVTSVRPGGPAGEAKPQIAPSDVLVSVEGKPVNSAAELRTVTAAITEGKTEPTPVLVGFERKQGQYVTVVKVGIKELEDPGLEVRKAWLPVETQVLTRDIARGLGQPDLTGFRVTRVYPGSTAEKAGLQVGDLILALDGEALTASAPEHWEELPSRIRQYKIGTTADLTVLRGADKRTVPVELVESPKLSREMKKYRDLGFEFTVRDITFFDKSNEKWTESQQGVLVDEVVPGGWAALGLLDVGDLIVDVAGHPVTDVESFTASMKSIEAAKPDVVVFRVMRGIHSMYLEMRPEWES